MTDSYKFVINGTDKTRKMFKNIRSNLGKMGKAIGGIGVVGVGAMGLLVKSTLKTNDELAKTADKLGITTTALGGLQHAASLAGVDNAVLNKSLQKLTVNLYEAADGTGLAKDAIKDLGLDAKELAKLSPDQAFIKITEAMEGVEDQTTKVGMAYDIFGAKGVDLVNVMSGGAEALKTTMNEAQTLGVTINRIDAAKIEQANDAMHRGTQVTKGFANSITVSLSPFIEEAGNQFYNAALESGGFAETTGKALDYVISGVGYAANVIHGLKAVWIGVKLVAATAITGILELIELLDKGITAFMNSIPGVEAKTSAFIGGMADAMRSQMVELQTELAVFAQKPLPREAIIEWAEEVQRKAQETAEVIAETKALIDAPVVAGKEKDEDKKDKDKLKKTKTTEEKLLAIKIGSSKKLAAIQKGIQLKVAIGDGYVAVQKAIASAPFPLNVPAISFATAQTLGNVAAIGGLEQGGLVGNRSIVEVGERNKPEVLQWGGKNYLLGGNNGSVFNRFQLDKPRNQTAATASGNLYYSPSFTVMDAAGVAEVLEQHQETLYNLYVNARADRGLEA